MRIFYQFQFYFITKVLELIATKGREITKIFVFNKQMTQGFEVFFEKQNSSTVGEFI